MSSFFEQLQHKTWGKFESSFIANESAKSYFLTTETRPSDRNHSKVSPELDRSRNARMRKIIGAIIIGKSKSHPTLGFPVMLRRTKVRLGNST